MVNVFLTTPTSAYAPPNFTILNFRKWRSAYRVFVGTLEGKRPLGRPRCRWEDNIKMDLRKIGFGVWAGFI
jgi:hypothetical protein